MDRTYADRVDAGDVLAGALAGYAAREDVAVLGLPRGGVPVAARVAVALRAPLDIVVVRKIGLPTQPELAMGAIAGVGDAVETVRNNGVIQRASVSDADFDAARRAELQQLRRRVRDYRGSRGSTPVYGRIVILVDDGLATGSTMRAALAAVRRERPARVVIAVPIAAASVCAELAHDADEIVCPLTPVDFWAVAQGYRDFTATTDDEVRRLLAEFRE